METMHVIDSDNSLKRPYVALRVGSEQRCVAVIRSTSRSSFARGSVNRSTAGEDRVSVEGQV